MMTAVNVGSPSPPVRVGAADGLRRMSLREAPGRFSRHLVTAQTFASAIVPWSGAPSILILGARALADPRHDRLPARPAAGGRRPSRARRRVLLRGRPSTTCG